MRALASLLACSLLAAAFYTITTLVRPGGYAGPIPTGLLAFQFTFILGLVPVVLYGAPLYMWLQVKGRLSWPVVISLGAIPGTIALPFGWSFGVVAIGIGVAVSCLTHYLVKNDAALVRSNKSLERGRDR